MSSIYKVHDEAKDKAFELEMSWVCDESKQQHQKVIPDTHFGHTLLSAFLLASSASSNYILSAIRIELCLCFIQFLILQLASCISSKLGTCNPYVNATFFSLMDGSHKRFPASHKILVLEIPHFSKLRKLGLLIPWSKYFHT